MLPERQINLLSIFLSVILISVNSISSGYSNLQYGHRLDRRVIDSFLNYDIQDCAVECWRWTRCVSFNYHQGTSFCEISYERRAETRTMYLEDPYWIYSEKQDWDKEISGPCSKSKCQINEKYLTQSNGSFKCLLSDCGFPVTGHLTNDNVQRWDGIAVGRSLHLRCADRYRLQVGSGLHRCHSDGQWETSITCHECDQGWFSYESHCYFYNSTQSSWDDAKLQCQAHSSYLLELNSREESQWIISTFLETRDECQDVYICPVNAWIGGTDHAIEGRFTWNGRTDMTFTNWYTFQPDGRLSSQDCVQIMRNGYWDDLNCDFEMSFICEHQ